MKTQLKKFVEPFSAVSQLEWALMLEAGWSYGRVGSQPVLRAPDGTLYWSYSDLEEMKAATGADVRCAADCAGECDCVAVGAVFDDEGEFVAM